MGDVPITEGFAPSFWRDTLGPYAIPNTRRASADVATSVLPYLAVTALMYAVRDVSAALVLVLALPAAGFLVRTFIVFHDCAHGSFLPNRRAYLWAGWVGRLPVFPPVCYWCRNPAAPPRPSCDPAPRGTRGPPPPTVDEYPAPPSK